MNKQLLIQKNGIIYINGALISQFQKAGFTILAKPNPDDKLELEVAICDPKAYFELFDLNFKTQSKPLTLIISFNIDLNLIANTNKNNTINIPNYYYNILHHPKFQNKITKKEIDILYEIIISDFSNYENNIFQNNDEKHIYNILTKFYPHNKEKQINLLFCMSLAFILSTENTDNINTIRQDILLPLAQILGIKAAFLIEIFIINHIKLVKKIKQTIQDEI